MDAPEKAGGTRPTQTGDFDRCGWETSVRCKTGSSARAAGAAGGAGSIGFLLPGSPAGAGGA